MAVPTGISVVSVDETTTYQQMIGFGAAMSDAAVYLIIEFPGDPIRIRAEV